MSAGAAPRHISSAANPLLRQVQRLAADPGAYRRLGLAWLEGDHLCRAYVARGGVPREAVLAERAMASPALAGLAAHAERVSVIDDKLMAAFSTLESPAAIGFLVAVPAASRPLAEPVTGLVLDRLQDAGNVGSILRSAAALGVRQVVALKGTVALWSHKVLRAGMGAHFSLRLVEGVACDDEETLGLVAAPWVATSSHGGVDLPQARLPRPCTWVFGHEGQGVAPALLARCTTTVCIPQPGGEESLNVAAAAAICLYASQLAAG
jgi:TrmH family RNA methyltransferase